LQDVCKGLDHLARLVENSSETSEIQKAIQGLLKILASEPSTSESLKKLENELKIWQEKLPVILMEPIGRKGMAKHARFWASQLEN